MDHLHKLWSVARHQLLLWAVGSLLFTAIMTCMGWGGTFSASSHRGKPGSAQPGPKDAPSPHKAW